MPELLFVLIAYMNLAISLEFLQKNPNLVQNSEKMSSKDPKLFYQNGHKLSLKYLSDDHPLTKKFQYLLSHGIEETGINLKPLTYNLNFEDSEDNQLQGRNSFLNNMESFDKTSETEDGFFKKKNKQFRVQTKKNFDSRAKSLSKVRSNEEEEEESFQAFPNMKLNKSHNFSKDAPYKKHIKELEKTVKEMKKLKEKYERNENTFFLQKNLELLFQQKELEEFISKRRDFQSSVMYPNTSGMFYMSPPQVGPMFGMNKAPSMVDPNNLANTTELLLQKQKEMEAALINLQRENMRIMQEKEEKNKEMNRLQEYILKIESEKASTELERKLKGFDSSKEMKGKHLGINELNIAPASSFNNLNESNISESSKKGKYSNREDRKFNLPLDGLKEEDKKTESRPENKNPMKKSTPMNKIPSSQIIPPANNNEQITKKPNNSNSGQSGNPVQPGMNVPMPIVGIKKSSSKRINERVPSQEKVKPQIVDKQIQRPPIQEKQLISTEKAAVGLLEKKNSEKKDTSFAPNIENSFQNANNSNNHELLRKRTDSIRKILIEFRGLNSHFNTMESLKKQDSLSSIDLALEVVNPSHILKNIFNFLGKSVVVRKKVSIDSKVFIFEFRISQENENPLFKLLALYESTGKPAIKEEILHINLIRKILQNIDYRDVIPFIFPLKTITGVMKFSRYFILPFLGIGDIRSPIADEERKVEIWPKAHGLIDKNIKIVFMGDEFFMFFHFLVNDCFRLVLSNAKNGVTLRVEYQFDASSMKKFLEPLENPKTQFDEIQDIIRLVEILEEEDITPEHIKEAQTTIAKYLQNKSETEIFIENYRVLDLTVFISFLEKTIKEFEELLKSRGFSNLEPLISEDKVRIFKVKVWSEGNRYRFGILLENTERREFEIVLKNGFESHAPMKKMVKALGTTSSTFDAIWKTFGLVYNKMDTSDKYMIASIVLDSYSLEVHEKALDKDDYERYEENPIIPLTLECGGFLRTFVGTNYKFPLTLSMIGYQGTPIGVKVVMFDPSECKETGMFFTVNAEIWKKKGLSEQNKKKNHRYLSVIPIEADYHLHYVLGKVGYRVILNSMQYEKGNIGGVDNLGKSLIKGNVSIVDNLENVITIPTILEFYKNEEM